MLPCSTPSVQKSNQGRKRLWSVPVDALEASAEQQLAQGPPTLASLFEYPSLIAQNLVAPSAPGRSMLLTALRNGILLRTHFSGMLTPEVGLQAFIEAVSHAGTRQRVQ